MANTYGKASGTFRNITTIKAKVSGTWRDVVTGYAKVSGVWEPVYYSFIQATGGSISDTTIGGVPYRVHTFTSSGTLSISSAPPTATIEAFLWGGGGGIGGFTDTSGDPGRGGRNGGSGGGSAYARNLGLAVSMQKT
jgi:hypothetical protein